MIGLRILQTITVGAILCMGYMLVLTLEHGTPPETALFEFVISMNWHVYNQTRARIRKLN